MTRLAVLLPLAAVIWVAFPLAIARFLRGPKTEEREAVQDAPSEPYLCLRHNGECGHDAQMEFADEVAISMEAGFFWDPPGGGIGEYDDLGADGETEKQEISLLTALWLAGDVPVVPGRMPGERAS